MIPLTAPNLPKREVRLAAAQAGPWTAALEQYGVWVVSPAPNAALPAETAGHADMLICHAGGKRLFAEPAQTALADELASFGFEVRFSSSLGGAYPADVRLNAAVGNGFALGNFRCVEPSLVSFLTRSGRRLLQVRQGYAKCSLCFVAENAFITEDAGVAAVLRREGADVLSISAGDVALSDVHTGFFGGASGLLAPDLLAVNGSLVTHRDEEAITAFLKKYSVRALSLSDGPVTDIGGILPLMEGKEV